MNRKTGMQLLFGLVALLLLAHPAALRADPQEDFKRLGQQCWKEILTGNYAEAERLVLRLQEMAEGPLADDPRVLAVALKTRAALHRAQFRYAEAEPLYKQVLAIYEELRGAEDPYTAQSLNDLAAMYVKLGRYAEAEPLVKRVLEIKKEAVLAEHPATVGSLNDLALIYKNLGRYAEAESLYKRALAIREKKLGPNHSETASSLQNLAILYRAQRRCTEAEPLYKRALAIHESLASREQPPGTDHLHTALSLNNLAELYSVQGRYAEAEPLYQRSLAIHEKVAGKEHRLTAESLNNLAIMYSNQDRYAEAEQHYHRALAIYEETLGPKHPRTAGSLNNLANLYVKQDHYVEAEPLFQRALAIKVKTLGAEHFDTALSLINLGFLYSKQGNYAEAEPLCSRAVAIMEKVDAEAEPLCDAYSALAEVAWNTDRPERAVADLRRAMKIVERIRAKSSGSEFQQAQSFAQYSWVFETMVDWQTELDNPAEGLEAIERSRARGLVDQMATAGMDLLAGVDEELAAGIRHREQETQVRVAGLRKQLELLAGRDDLSADQRRVEQEKLQAELRQAQQDYAATCAEIHNASPVCRLAMGEDRKPVPLAKLRQRAADQDALLLEYLLGEKEGYVLIVPGDGKPRMEKLAVTDRQAKSLGIDNGPLTAKRLEAVLGNNDQKTGLLQRLARPSNSEEAKQIAASLAVLWEVLIPEAQRKAIRADEYKRLIVAPDGTLANLPFEALVVETGDDPKHLLDAGPPIQYTPSATILINLANRQGESVNKADEPVLTVGDCQYGAAGGKLRPLFYSKWEVAWVAEVFKKGKIGVTRLEGTMADERNVRSNLSGRRLLHFACHGLADQAYGNLFGGLALTPGPKADDPTNDGFLTLAEVYEQNLTGCELAILSACDTNTGPEQRGEGVWALSRGFLVAGSRRVVASNWLVDDKAAASLVSYYCSILVKAEKEGRTPDYAEALHQAKRWVRSQKKWKNPYYWATFVLMGPH